jgi:hypothetical protein
MKTIFALFAFTLAHVVFAAPTIRSFLEINTPCVVQHVLPGFVLTLVSSTGATQCEPTRFTWSGGKPPYFLQVTKPLDSHDYLGVETVAKSYIWDVNVPSGEFR